MKNFLFKKIVVSSVVILLLALNAFTYEINILADNLEYDEHSSQLLAKGNVIFEWEEKKVFADYVEFDQKTVKARGNVKVEESKNTIYADSVTYNYDEENGCIEETFGHHSSDVFIHTKSMEIQNKDTYAINGIKLSKCDLDNPHIHAKAKRGKLILNKRLIIYNAVFYIGKIPVFYFPIFTKSLKSDKSFGSDLKFEINPKLADDKTVYLNTVISCVLSESLKGKIFADFLKKSGNVHGVKIDYTAEDATGSIFANETNNFEKWILTADYLHMIDDMWRLQSRVWVTNNKDIDNYHYDYGENRRNILDSFISDSLSFYRYSRFYAAVTRHGCDTNLNMSVEHKTYEGYNGHKDKVSYMLLPNIELTSYSRNIFMGIIHKFHFRYQNVYGQYQCKQSYYSDDYETYDNSFYKSDSFIIISCLNYKLMRSFKFGNLFTLVPAIKVELAPSSVGNFREKKLGGLLSSYSGSLNARFRVTDWMDWNVNYSLKAITEKNSLCMETLGSACGGIEKNSISVNNNMYFGKQTIVQNFFCYNLQRCELNDTKNNRLSPCITEVTCVLNNYMTVFARQEQFLDPFRFGSLNLDLTIGKLDKAYLNFDAFYQRYNKFELCKNREINNTLGFGLCLTPKWRIDYNIKAMVSLDSLSYNRITEQELKICRNLHCYALGIFWKKCNNNEGIFLKFSTKTNWKDAAWWGSEEERHLPYL
jgi:LPS-assembly protein